MLKILGFFLAISSAYSTEFCKRSEQDISLQLLDQNSRISFNNQGGLFNGGTCWWHSRLQRSSIYLIHYSPRKPKPNEETVQKIFKSLKNMDKVVEVPGYENFYDFTLDHFQEAQKLLEHWQIQDGFLYQQWLKGLSGKSLVSAEVLKTKMDDIYLEYKSKGTISWLMAQMKGIASHAFLLMSMTKMKNGYHLDVIDSNYPLLVSTIEYQEGQRALILNKNSIVPYLGFNKDLQKIKRAISSYCLNK